MRHLQTALLLLSILLGGCALAVLLAGCGGDEDATPGQHVAAVVLEQWEARGSLSAPDDRGWRCGHLDDLRIHEPTTLADYTARCPEQSWACLRWELVSPRAVLARYRPVAVMSPMLPRELVLANAVHESLHSVFLCAYGRYDYTHDDDRVWEHYLPNDNADVESRALIELGY